MPIDLSNDPLIKAEIARYDEHIKELREELKEYDAIVAKIERLESVKAALLGTLSIGDTGKKRKSVSRTTQGTRNVQEGQHRRWELVEQYVTLRPELKDSGKREQELKMNKEFEKYKKAHPDATKEQFLEAEKKKK